jgi:hypothetical protein
MGERWLHWNSLPRRLDASRAAQAIDLEFQPVELLGW